ncbi:amidohydrolase family protein [Cysteiniphilum halobium]|uniref:metal-dependent hydrolase family protein n=1 Tax=Cysteiniphilum halobium TaxID=2219059 RepID=UPI003F83A1BF
MRSFLIENVSVFNGQDNEIKDYHYLYIEEGIIKALTNERIADFTSQEIIDAKGMYLMPGLIDAHVHLSTASSVDLANDHLPQDYLAINAIDAAKESLVRGFTTLRDAGGAGLGIARSFSMRKESTPRLFYSGKALSATNGHGDFRHSAESECCSCQVSGSNISTLCDGVPEVLKATREQLREGATQIKIMAAGGIASPTDKVQSLQFSDQEILAIVDEANRNGTYVMAHAYTPEALIRCVKLGVRSLEHANLLDEKSAKYINEKKGVFIVPTLSIYEALYQHGKEYNTPAVVLEKLEEVRASCIKAIKIAHKYNVNLGFGTDLLGGLMQYQCSEFILRSKAETAFQTLYSATYKNAELLNMEKKLGFIGQGAYADIIAVDKNPLNDISVMANPLDNLKLIIKDGYIVLNKI